jgi:DNA-binding transcriptional LysR family regulator
MDLSLRALRYVRAAMRLGSITAAAEEMHVAASAVGVALDQAEAVFGLKLVSRARSKGISPTTVGRDVLQRIEDLLERYEAMLARSVELRSGLSGLLRIGYYAPIAPAFLPQVIEPLIDANPTLSVALEECDNPQTQAGLLQGTYDVILFVVDAPVPQIEVTRLIHAPIYCLCAATHPFAQRDSVTLLEVAAEPLVILNRPGVTSYYRELLERAGQTLNVVATATSTEMVRSLVGYGLGCAVLNMQPLIQQSYAGDELACLPISGEASGLTLCLGTIPGPPRRVIHAFSEACVSYFSSHASSGLVVTAPR